jgi:hypothetical protein
MNRYAHNHRRSVLPPRVAVRGRRVCVAPDVLRWDVVVRCVLCPAIQEPGGRTPGGLSTPRD